MYVNESYLDQPNAISSTRPGLGRLVSIDHRDRNYPMRAYAPPVVRVRTWNIRRVLDQNGTPQCVGYASKNLLLAGPVTNRKVTDPQPADIYHEAQKVDEWDGEDYEGTSVRAGMKVLQSMGFLSSYVWASSALQAAAHIANTSPVVFGIDWLEGMLKPDAKGFLRATGETYGGHAICAVGVNLDMRCPDGTTGAIRLLNSWGEGWGERGRAWISIADLDKLLKNWGEAAAPVEIKRG